MSAQVPRKKRSVAASGPRRSGKRSRGTVLSPQITTETIELLESSRRSTEDVVDLTHEALDPPVVDLTNNDSVVLVDESLQGNRGVSSESYVLSSDEEEGNRTSRAAFLSALEANSSARAAPGTISCPVCLDTYGEIVDSGRLVVSTKCGHLFCSQCLRDSLAESHTCPTCRKKLTNRQYHPIYI